MPVCVFFIARNKLISSNILLSVTIICDCRPIKYDCGIVQADVHSRHDNITSRKTMVKLSGGVGGREGIVLFGNINCEKWKIWKYETGGKNG